MGGKGGGGEGMPGMTGDNMQNIGVLDQAMNSVGSTTGPNDAFKWMMSGGGAGEATAAANAPKAEAPAAAPAAAAAAPSATEVAEPAAVQGTGSQTTQDTGAGDTLAQAVAMPQTWQDELKKATSPATGQGSMELTGQV